MDGVQFKYLILQPFQILQTHKTNELGWLPLGIQWPLHQISCKQKYYLCIYLNVFFKMNKIHVFPIFFHFYVILLSMNVFTIGNLCSNKFFIVSICVLGVFSIRLEEMIKSVVPMPVHLGIWWQYVLELEYVALFFTTTLLKLATIIVQKKMKEKTQV